MAPFYSIRRFFSSLVSPPREVGVQSRGPQSYSVAAATPVTLDSALQISAVWAAVRITAETIGSLPFMLYRRTPEGRVPAVDHPLYLVLTQRPNRYQTVVEFWESIVMALCLGGNSYAIIQRVNGKIVGLLPVPADKVETKLLDDGSVVHVYTSGADVAVYSSENIWHIKLFGNGIIGLSPLDYARNSVGIASAADNRMSKIFSNGAKPAGVLMVDKTLSKEQRQQIRASYSDLAEGGEDRLFVLEQSMSYQQVSMTPKDAELLSSRRFQIEDIGRFFGVPSILLNQTFGQSSLGSNVYEILSAFYKINLRPYAERIESSISRWLMGAERDQYEGEFNFDALLRADRKTRMEANREAINSSQLTPNEARVDEGLRPLPGGDRLYIQGAMTPTESAGVQPQ